VVYVFIPAELCHKALELCVVDSEFVFSLSEVVKLETGGGCQIGVAEGVLEDLNDIFCICEVNLVILYVGENLLLGMSF